MIKQTTGSSLRMSIKAINDSWKLGEGVVSTGWYEWAINDGKKSKINIEINTRDELCFVEFIYYIKDKPFRYKVSLVTTRPHYGGKRWWFVCPITGERCTVLYLPPDQVMFASRKAYNLTYSSQNETHYDRFSRSYDRYCGKLGFDRHVSWFHRPKGMHEKTYQKHVSNLSDFEDRFEAIFLQLCGRRF